MIKISLICIPSVDDRGLDSVISGHFGKTPYFTLLKTENNEIKNVNIVKSRGKHSGGSKTPAEIIIDSNADVLICGNLGPKAVLMLRNNGINIFSGASGTVKDAYDMWKSGKLALTYESSCNEKL